MKGEQFHSPFSSVADIRPLLQRHRADDAKAKVRDQQAFAAGKQLLEGARVRKNISIIFRWKLQSFYRFPWVRAFPEESSDEDINLAVARARDARASDEASVSEAILAFTRLRRVGIPVASAFLAAMHPRQFTVMDRQAYKALQVSFRPSIPGYLKYLQFCRREAKRLGVSLRKHDEALWQYGKQMRRSHR
jgi:hypothetical protein